MPTRKSKTSFTNNNTNVNSADSDNSITTTTTKHTTATAAVTPATSTTTAPLELSCGDENSVLLVSVDLVAEQRQQLYLANAKLCRLVRKSPWMYDRNHMNYGKKQLLDKSWAKIAKECNDSVHSCKERWRNIRAAFARSINVYKTIGGPNRVKPYYLHNELRFLVKPMLENRDKQNINDAAPYEDVVAQSNNKKENDCFSKEETFEENANDHNESKEMENFFNLEPQLELLNNDIEIEKNKSLINEQNHTISIDDNFSRTVGAATIEIKTHVPSLNTCRPMTSQNWSIDSNSRCLSFAENIDADKKFLEALLPDISAMNLRQKIVFKRKIYQALEEVFETTDFPKRQTPAKLSKKQMLINSIEKFNDNELIDLEAMMRNHFQQMPTLTPTQQQTQFTCENMINLTKTTQAAQQIDSQNLNVANENYGNGNFGQIDVTKVKSEIENFDYYY